MRLSRKLGQKRSPVKVETLNELPLGCSRLVEHRRHCPNKPFATIKRIYKVIKNRELIAFIQEYEGYIKKGNEILQTFFMVNKSPLLAKREGEIPKHGKIESENMTFDFHGMGCRLEFGAIVVDFDYSFSDFAYKGFESSKLYWFIVSHPDFDRRITREGFNEALKQLEKVGFIISKDESSHDTYDYILNTDRV